jgi:hypothetical protein
MLLTNVTGGKSLKVNIPCNIASGKLDLNKERFSLLLAKLKDGRYNLTIEPETNLISHQQRKYFFGVVVDRIRLGFLDKGIITTVDEVRALLNELFIHRLEYNPVLDTTLKVPISLSNSSKGIDKAEFNTIVNLIQQHAMQEWSIEIPDPNEIDYSTK